MEEAAVREARKQHESTPAEFLTKAEVLPKRLDSLGLEQQQRDTRSAAAAPRERVVGLHIERRPVVRTTPVQPHQYPRQDQSGAEVTLEDYRMLRGTCPADISLSE